MRLCRILVAQIPKPAATAAAMIVGSISYKVRRSMRLATRYIIIDSKAPIDLMTRGNIRIR